MSVRPPYPTPSAPARRLSRNRSAERRGIEQPLDVTLPSSRTARRAFGPRLRRGLALLACAAALPSLGAAGCGGSAERPGGPLDVSTLEGAEAELTRAEDSLARALGDAGGAAGGAQGGVHEAPKTPTPEDLPPPSRPPDSSPTATQAGSQPPASTCETACDALASMRRAAERVCVLDPARCGPARARVERAEQRVKAHCSECE